MSVKRILLVTVVGVMLLAGGVAPSVASSVQAEPFLSVAEAGDATIPYAGTLTDAVGRPVPDGAYDFRFSLYSAENGGHALWSEAQTGLRMRGGEFGTVLGRANPIPTAVGSEPWLAVEVRGPGEGVFTALSPRQRLSSALSTVQSGTTAGSACPHDHLGEVWSGWASTSTDGLWLKGNVGWPLGMFLVDSNGTGPAIWGYNNGGGNAVRGEGIGPNSLGVYGYSEQDAGVRGQSDTGNAVYAEGRGSGNTHAALWANNPGSGLAAYLTNNSGYPTLEIDKTGSGGAAIDLQLFSPGNDDPAVFIKGYDENTVLQFLISANGIVAANGYVNWKADIAEMLPASGDPEPGDVLAIGTDGTLIRSTEPYQTNIAGVYSTDPGFMFGHPLEGEIPGTIPLAVTGVVPVKVSAENGPIRPGDLLVASATPGYAMRAEPNPPQGTVIGKALAKLDDGAGVIEMLATLQ